MAQFKLAELFDYRNVTPSSLQKGNLIYFKYSSPNGVHDKSPLVYVLEKTFDKIYGLNLHYDFSEIQTLTENVDFKVNNFLEKKFFSKYPEKRKELKNIEFDNSLIDEKELIEFKKSFNKKDLEIFDLNSFGNNYNFRSYLYKRMNNVSKLVYKL